MLDSHETNSRLQPDTSSTDTKYRYSAFISYSTDADSQLSDVLQRALQRFAKPWYRPRGIRIFRDITGLSAQGNLGAAIRTALDGSEFLILLASPKAAESPWVAKELEHWLTQDRSLSNILITVTDGQIETVHPNNGFDGRTDVIPQILLDRYADTPYSEMPRWIDLRRAEDLDLKKVRSGRISLLPPAFRDGVADLAAPLHNRPKDDLYGEDIRQHRIRRMIDTTAILILCLLLLVAAGFAYYANDRRAEADRQRAAADEQQRSAVARSLAFEAESLRDTQPTIAMRLGVAAQSIGASPDTRDSLVNTIIGSHHRGTLTDHTDTVSSLALSRDGRIVLTGSYDGTASLWDITNRTTPRRLGSLTHTLAVNAVAISPDGSRALTGSADKTAALWDITDPTHPRRISTLVGHSSSVNAVAFGINGRTVLTGSYNDDAVIWDIAEPTTPRPLGSIPNGGTGAGIVAVGSDGHTAIVGRPADPAMLPPTVTTIHDELVLWDFTKPAAPKRLGVLASQELPRPGRIRAFALSHDGHTLLTGGDDGTAVLWDLSKPGVSKRLGTLTGHLASVNAVALSPDGRSALTGSADKTAALWDITDPSSPRLVTTLIGHTDQVETVAISPDGRTALTGGADKVVLIWDLTDPSATRRTATLTGHSERVDSVAMSRDGHIALTGSADATAEVWDLTDQASPKRLSTLYGHIHKVDLSTNTPIGVSTVAISPNGRTAMTGGDDGVAILWDISTPTAPRKLGQLPNHDTIVGSKTYQTGPTFNVNSAVFSADGRTLLTGGGQVILWNVADPANPERLGALTSSDGRTVRSIALSPDGRTALTGNSDKTATLWNIANPASPKQMGVLKRHTDTVESVAFGPDGHTVVTASADHSAILWDVTDTTTPKYLATLIGHTKSVVSVAISPDGHAALTGSADGIAILWNISNPTSPKRLRTLSGHTGTVESVAFGPSGSTAITGSDDHTAGLWDITDVAEALAHPSERACAIVARGLDPQEWSNYVRVLDYRQTCP